jgi:protein ImuA
MADIPAISRHFSASLTGDADARLALAPALDAVLAGGLDRRRLHEIVPGSLFHLGAAAGFAGALAALSDAKNHEGTLVWIQQRMAALEGGTLYGLGGAAFGIATARWLLVETATAKDALWAMEESLRTPGITAVIGEFSGAGDAADLTATRRLNLVLQERATLGLLLRQQPLAGTSAASTRWRVAGARGASDGLPGIGGTAFALTLEKNQRGPCGAWHVEWNGHDRSFAALPVAVAAPAAQRPRRAA